LLQNLQVFDRLVHGGAGRSSSPWSLPALSHSTLHYPYAASAIDVNNFLKRGLAFISSLHFPQRPDIVQDW